MLKEHRQRTTQKIRPNMALTLPVEASCTAVRHNGPVGHTGPHATCNASPESRPYRMQLPYIPNRQTYEEACQLLKNFGGAAGVEASERAEAARVVGNHIHFCHWRQIERLLVIMNLDMSIGTVH